MNRSPRECFESAATALALRKGGMTACADSIVALSDALDSYPRAAPGDDLGPAHGRARVVIDARLASDESRFATAKYALELEMAAYWALRARALPSKGKF